jgi:hypothetical protein
MESHIRLKNIELIFENFNEIQGIKPFFIIVSSIFKFDDYASGKA